MPIPVFLNFVRSIPGLQSKLWLIGLCIVATTVFGCVPFTATPQQQNTNTQQINTADAYITLDESALTVHHFLDSAAEERIAAEQPKFVVWSSENNAVAWVETTTVGSRIVTLDTESQRRETPYESRQQITAVTFSPRGDSMAFVEEQSLYIMTVHGEQLQRIAEEVLEYAWSPNNRTLAVSTIDRTLLATPSLQTEAIVYADVRTDQPIRGLLFRRTETLLGFVVNNGSELIEEDTQNHTSRVLKEWTATADDTVLPVAVTSWLSPDQSTMLIEETTNTGAHHVTQYTFATDSRVQVPGEARMQGWYGPHVPILFQDFHLVAKQAILQGVTQLFIEVSKPPVFVRSYTAL